eukprot:1139583-Amphidinium_carterae.1
MAPPFESLPKKLEKLQHDQQVSDSQPAAKKMPIKVKPAAAADHRSAAGASGGTRTVPPPPPPPVHADSDARRDDEREDPGDVALLGRVNLTPRRRPAKRQKIGKSSPQNFSPSMAWS